MPSVYISVVEQILSFLVMFYDLIRSFIVTIVQYMGISPSLQYEVSALISTLFLFLSLMAVWIAVQKVRGKREGKKAERIVEQHPYIDFPLPALEIEEGRLEDTLNSITELRAEGKISEEDFLNLKEYYGGLLSEVRDRINDLREEWEIAELKRKAGVIAPVEGPVIPSAPSEAVSKPPVAPPSVEYVQPLPTQERRVEVIETSPLIEEMIRSIDSIVKEFKKEK
ncbi:MAG: hypothetical protein ACTSYT_01650 [Candidatus Asgardarchaeia archaeon]